jgi:guanosine-3',5'-bis(diphosphate) 3'-pyrophosphohydrolase
MNNTKTLINSINFAAIKHVSQRRKNKSSDPYINHPIELVNILVNCGIENNDVLCAAVLHDTIEDTKTTLEELVENFGENIANIVMECTDDKKLDQVTRKKLQIEHAKTTSDNAKLVKLADKYSNLKSLIIDPPVTWSTSRIKGYMVWSIACCSNLYGVNGAEKLDKLLKEFFELNNITCDNLDDKLEKYYNELKK